LPFKQSMDYHTNMQMTQTPNKCVLHYKIQPWNVWMMVCERIQSKWMTMTYY